MLFETQDGSHSLFSEKYGVSYHSKYGAIQETQHVFINAGLRLKAIEQKDISILEIGFGTGLNAYMTIFESEKRGLTIDYVGVEAYPVSKEITRQLNYAAQVNEPESQLIFNKIHEIDWDVPHSINAHFRLTKVNKKFEDLDFDAQFDLIYFDAFAPTSQPELWEVPLLTSMFNALKSGGVLVTYCAKGQFKRNLKAVGFTVEAIPGPPGKREMTRAFKF
jgi:tRNA U34 5-methylaminomethyl-2-thiouridine-forming methyltransferase MnmC